MVRGTMKASKLLTICLFVIMSSQAWGSRVFWLKTYGPGSLSFWQNKYLPNTDNLCRNGLGMGSKFYWDSCGYDPANPTVLLPGTKLHWEKGYGPGTLRYWNTVMTPFNGMSQSQMCTSPYGYKPGMKLYYTHCTGPGSKAYWESGTERGSSIYWRAGLERSVAVDWVGPCMDTNLDVAWCKQMRQDVALQNASMLDWSSNLTPFANIVQSQANQAPCNNNSALSPAEQQSLMDLVANAAEAAGYVLQQSGY